MDKSLPRLLICVLTLAYGMPLSALSLNGTTRYASIVEISARVAGVVEKVRVRPGQRVTQGDELVELDATPYRARLAKAGARVKQLQPALISAELELERAFELYDRDSLSQIEMKNAENKAAAAQGAVAQAEAEVDLANYELRQARLEAPITGRVMAVHARQGQYVNPDVALSPLITLVDSRRMLAVAVLNTDQWQANLVGKKATVMIRGKKYLAQVARIGYQRIQKADGLPAYEIALSFSTSELLPADMPVSIEIQE